MGIHFLCSICLVGVITIVNGTLQGPMSTWRMARSKLKAEIRGHQAVQRTLNPAEDRDKQFVDISFQFWPYKVLGVDEVLQSITTVSYMVLKWRDKDLAWNASDYQGISFITLNYEEIWHPNLMILNGAEVDSLMLRVNIPVVTLKNDGTFVFTAPLYLKTSCIFDLTYYPLDTQMCNILFVAFFDDCNTRILSAELTRMREPARLGGEWNIDAREISTSNYTTILFNQPTINVTLLLRRSVSYYVLSVMAPMLLTSMMSSLVFLMPPACGEKVSFLVSIFVSNSVFLGFMVSSMPRSLSELPRIALFLLVVMGQCFLALLATLFVIHRYHEELQEEDGHGIAQVEREPTSDTKLGAGRCSSPSVNVVQRSSMKSVRDYVKQNMTQSRRKSGVDQIHTSKKACKCAIYPFRPDERNGILLYIRRIKSRQWDFVFFMLYHVTGIPCYIALFFFK